MSAIHVVRVGNVGQIGHFSSAEAISHARGARVVVQTARGLEIGQVLAAPPGADVAESDGLILRRLTTEDELLESRLTKRRGEAYTACVEKIATLGLPIVLVDVELLFDGQTVAFYFLGDRSELLDSVLAELAETYEAKAEIRKFAETLTAGCGPDCGTGDAEGGCGSCDTGCAISSACGTSRRSRESA